MYEEMSSNVRGFLKSPLFELVPGSMFRASKGFPGFGGPDFLLHIFRFL